MNHFVLSFLLDFNFCFLGKFVGGDKRRVIGFLHGEYYSLSLVCK